MAQKRRKKEKVKAHHQFTISWLNEAKKGDSEPNVNRQFQGGLETKLSKRHSIKSVINMAKEESLPHIKHDITRSLILASLILGIEVVIYLIWH